MKKLFTKISNSFFFERNFLFAGCFLLSLFLGGNSILKAQTTMLFFDDFKSGAGKFILNSGGTGSPSGPNQWIVNKNYGGAPTYPNTMSQDSTYGGKISGAPQSEYLHIHDNASGITNCNYNPTAASDRFVEMTNGVCTLGMDSVYFTFFYLCEGGPLDYGSLYYNADNGGWIKTGQSLYNNKSKWQFEKFTDPAFSNVTDLRFGFRWKNSGAATVNSAAFAIDDIIMVGKYDKLNSSVDIVVDDVSPSPVCPGDNVTVDFHFTGPLCDGNYNLELSNSSGTFPGIAQWGFTVPLSQTGFQLSIPITIPSTANPSNCYKIRINRASNPGPEITGLASNCFVVSSCPNIITTLKPSVTKDTNAVCIGSAIDIPFYSVGTFIGNIYKAELSDSSGNFPAVPVFFGSSNDSKTYDPAKGSPPGNVSGQIPKVPPGCKYYIRIVSTKPKATGAKWGPFCIGECDVTTNNKKDLQFCVTNCAADPAGQYQTISIDMHAFNNSEIYSSTNKFTTQVLDKKTMAQVGVNGLLGEIVSAKDTVLKLHMPCKEKLSTIGLKPGDYYMRIVATDGTPSDNTLGTIIRLSVGAPNATAPIITISPGNTVCTSGNFAYLSFTPYSAASNSTYLWTSNQVNFGVPFESPYTPNTYYYSLQQPSVVTFTAQETNFGCKGPVPSPVTLTILGPPDVFITGPSNACTGDTVNLSVPFQDSAYYSWTSSGGSIANLGNNEIDMVFGNSGTYQINIDALSFCGSSQGGTSIKIGNYPAINAGTDTSVCKNNTMNLNTPAGSNYTYKWYEDKNLIGTNRTELITVDSSRNYHVTVTSDGICVKTDSIKVSMVVPDSASTTDKICDGEPMSLNAGESGASYLWNTGATTQQITIDNPGSYNVSFKHSIDVCPKYLKIQVDKNEDCFHELKLPNIITLNEDGLNDFFEPEKKTDFKNFEIIIFNRWGEMVYESKNPAFKWDGKDQGGSLVSAGVYYYIAKAAYKTRPEKTHTGTVTVIR